MMQHLYDRLDAIREYGEKTARYERFSAEIEVKSDGRLVVYLWSKGEILDGFHRKRGEEDAIFDDAWQWLYAQPSPERRELNNFIKKISDAMEGLGEGDSEIVRDLYRKLFAVREDASKHLLEYKPESEQ